ncbi:MAG: hypothetical protein HZC40_24480 [Chloroflexi bacterium]|nr:hypothetical protein [Chloroflexota bacterium]
MSKKTFLTACVIGLLVLIASETPSVGAQGPLAHGATYLDNQWHWIGPDATVWYAFDYAGDRTVVMLTLTNGVQLGMLFSVYAPDKPSDQPIGRGTSSQVACNDGGRCQSPDLVWKGGTSSPGTYYVQVINKTSVAKSFLLWITNGSVTLYPSTSAPAQTTIYTPPVYVQPYTPPVYTPQYYPPYPQQSYYCPPGYYPGYRYSKSLTCYPYYSPYYYPAQYGYPYYR